MTATAYRNPIIPGFNPDPTICRVGDDYFLATSTFEYFPGVPIYTSRDLVNWKLIGHALNRPSQLEMRSVEAGGGIYAPTLRYHQGRWYMTTSCKFRESRLTEFDSWIHPRGFYVWTDNIWDETKWSDPVWYDVLGIDQDLFFDDDGKVYMPWATGIPNEPLPEGKVNLSIWIVEIDLETGDSLMKPKLLRHNTTTGNWVAEGPHIFKRGDWYYLLTAEGGTETEHQEWISRSKSVLGPYEVGPVGVNPLVYNAQDEHIMQTGHMDMIEGPDGRWWAVFLAVRPQDGRLSQLGRETFLCPVEWKDDWPIVNGGKKVTVEGEPAAGLPRVANEESWSYGFKPEMNLTHEGFFFLRTPQKAFHSLTSHPGSLALRGGPYTLLEDEAVSMVLRKQTAFIGEWKVKFDFQPTAPGEAAGAAVWWSKWCYGAVMLRGTADGGAELVYRMPDDDKGFTEHIFPASSTTVSVTIQARPDHYTFIAGGQEVGTLPATKLVQARPWDSFFTGTFFALFTHGEDGGGCLTPAVFSDFSWVGVRGDD